MSKAEPSNMIFDMRPGDVLRASGPVLVELVHKSGRAARLRVQVPRDVRITKVPYVCAEKVEASMAHCASS
jgi:uncharacterized protein YqjF (DUF2071 family)